MSKKHKKKTWYHKLKERGNFTLTELDKPSGKGKPETEYIPARQPSSYNPYANSTPYTNSVRDYYNSQQSNSIRSRNSETDYWREYYSNQNHQSRGYSSSNESLEEIRSKYSSHTYHNRSWNNTSWYSSSSGSKFIQDTLSAALKAVSILGLHNTNFKVHLTNLSTDAACFKGTNEIWLPSQVLTDSGNTQSYSTNESKVDMFSGLALFYSLGQYYHLHNRIDIFSSLIYYTIEKRTPGFGSYLDKFISYIIERKESADPNFLTTIAEIAMKPSVFKNESETEEDFLYASFRCFSRGLYPLPESPEWSKFFQELDSHLVNSVGKKNFNIDAVRLAMEPNWPTFYRHFVNDTVHGLQLNKLAGGVGLDEKSGKVDSTLGISDLSKPVLYGGKPKIVVKDYTNIVIKPSKEVKDCYIKESRSKSEINKFKESFELTTKTLDSFNTYGLRSGHLDEGNLHKLAFASQELFHHVNIKGTSSFDLTILVDTSGSTKKGTNYDYEYFPYYGNSVFSRMMRSVYIITEGLKGNSIINTEVYHHDGDCRGGVLIGKMYDSTDTNADFLDGLAEVFPDDINRDEHALNYLLNQIHNKNTERKKILINITDGLPNGSDAKESCKNVVNFYKRLGIIIVGIGIYNKGNTVGPEVLQEIYGSNGISINPDLSFSSQVCSKILSIIESQL